MVISQDGIAEKIEEFIWKEFVIRTDRVFGRDTDLYDSGYVDSAGAVELISFLESTFKLELHDGHIFSDAFTTINGISSVVAMCLAEKARACDEIHGVTSRASPATRGS